MKITIDHKEIEVISTDKNIVDVADRNKIGIPAPCYKAEERKGCCMGCAVEIDGEIKYACCTKPIDGMNIIIDRIDLKQIRKRNLSTYLRKLKDGTLEEGCTCGCSCSDGDGGCC
ncbi:MAG: (2Fe-2S)-binding protein [Candidatus Delongbacteria bacterium]|nr:(2Fe-2S)-binding protein [Candidatus Delongbacteria bacterium]